MTTESRENKYVRKKLVNLTKRSIQDSAGENTEQINNTMISACTASQSRASVPPLHYCLSSTGE